MKLHHRIFVLLLCLGSLLLSAAAAEMTASPPVRAERTNARYQVGEEVRFRLNLPAGAAEYSFRLAGNGANPVTGSGKIEGGSATITAKAERPGMIFCIVDYLMADGKKGSAWGGAGIALEQVKSETPDPKDFDEFWATAKAELAQVPANPITRPLPVDARFADQVEAFEVEMACPGGRPVRAVVTMPKNAQPKSLPLRINFPGAGVGSTRPTPEWALMGDGMLIIAFNAHGLPSGMPDSFYNELREGELRDYGKRDWDNPEKVYFRGIVQRLLRTFEYGRTLPAWDGKILISSGGSQGGWLATVGAALNPDVTCLAATVPAMSNLASDEAGWPQPKRFQSANAERSMPYLDTANFAARVRPEVDCFYSVGFIDGTCPAGSIYAAFNNLRSKNKFCQNDIEFPHRESPATRKAFDEFLLDHVKHMRQDNGTL